MKFTSTIAAVLALPLMAAADLDLTAQSRGRILDHHGRSMIVHYTNTLEEKPAPAPNLPKAGEKVGILGAGMGGLYSAIMLQSLGIPFEIIEGSDRVGGRLFTHKFEKGGKYDYYVQSFILFIRFHN